jgi:hypothetical protein
VLPPVGMSGCPAGSPSAFLGSSRHTGAHITPRSQTQQQAQPAGRAPMGTDSTMSNRVRQHMLRHHVDVPSQIGVADSTTKVSYDGSNSTTLGHRRNLGSSWSHGRAIAC